MKRLMLMAAACIAFAPLGCRTPSGTRPTTAGREFKPDPRELATRSGVATYSETTSVPGQPVRTKELRKEWYDGPVNAAPTNCAPPVNGTPIYNAPPVNGSLPSTAPSGSTGPTMLPPPRPELKPAPLPSASGTSLPSAADDEEIPKATITGVYGITPDGRRIPAKRYDAQGRLIEEKEEGPSLDLPPAATTPAVPRITPPPILLPPVPAVPTVPVPPLPEGIDRSRTASLRR